MPPYTGWVAVIVCASSIGASSAGEATLPEQASQALRKATAFFTERVATEGGYLWRYSEDLSRREGEGKAAAHTVWVQPPGSPSVGMAFLESYRATGDEVYLGAARRAGDCLVRGQVRSGGWDYRITFDPEERKRYDFRVDPPSRSKKVRRITVLDDNTTQAAVQFLIRLDQALEFKDAKIHKAAQYALDHLLGAQYPNGAFPQGFEGPPDPAKYPVTKADYPPSWSKTPVGKPYWTYYTLNDNVLADVVEVLFEAGRIYGEERCRRAAGRVGDFLLLAQMPDPQPAWAQQYDPDMHPAWARKFEPPSVTGGESQGAMRTLLAVYRETGDKKYVEPIPRAIAYLRRSQLPDGRLARFYELKTNKPLYFTRQYELTYDDGDMPTHYAFKVSHALDGIEREYQRLASLAVGEKRETDAGRRSRPAQPGAAVPHREPGAAVPSRPSPRLVQQVQSVIAALDEEGRWVEDGRLRYHGDSDPTRRVIDCQTFIRNVGILSSYLAAVKKKPGAAGLNAEPTAAARGPRLALDPGPRTPTAAPPEITGTFSIVAADPDSGVCGAAVASKFPAVGKVVPYVRPGVGAFCTQHWHNPAWGEKALDLLAQGKLPEEVLGQLLRGDPQSEKRQLAIIDMQGRAANRNPNRPDPSGVWWGGATGRYYACQGNTLTGREVVAAMARAYEETRGSLADRLVAALVAADRAGGDHRGRLAAGIRVSKKGVPGYWLELQVDQHPDAIGELARRYAEMDHDAKRAPRTKDSREAK